MDTLSVLTREESCSDRYRGWLPAYGMVKSKIMLGNTAKARFLETIKCICDLRAVHLLFVGDHILNTGPVLSTTSLVTGTGNRSLVWASYSSRSGYSSKMLRPCYSDQLQVLLWKEIVGKPEKNATIEDCHAVSPVSRALIRVHYTCIT